MLDGRELTRHGNGGAFEANSLVQFQAPGSQRTVGRGSRQHNGCSLVEQARVAVSVKFLEEYGNSVETALDNTPTTSLDDRRIGYEAEVWRSVETEEERQIRLRATRPLDPPNGF
jgi:hypothetical protein